MTGYAQYAPHYLAAGWSPLPIPHGRKTPIPEGFTGYEGAMATAEDVARWAAGAPDANIGLRMPETAVGIDYDAYKTEGVETMNRLVAELGPLPQTWRSSSRNDGSGIFFYRLPAGLPRIGDVGTGIETIRFAHRYAVVAPSAHPEGGTYRWYAPDGSSRAPRVDELAPLPDAWVQHLISRGERKMDAREALVNAPAVTYEALDDDERVRIDSYVDHTLDGIRGDLEESASWEVGQTDSIGRGWEKLQADKALRLAALALADWNPYTLEHARADFEAWAPRGGGWSDYDVSAKFQAQARRADPAPFPPSTSNAGDALLKGVMGTQGAPYQGAPQGQQVTTPREVVDVSNPARAVEWLRENLGQGGLSGIFLRERDVVFTPRIGSEGYIKPRAGQATDSASITVLDDKALAARVQSRYHVVKMSEVEDEASGKKRRVQVPALFPIQAAMHAVKAPDDQHGLRDLRGVVHSPTFRPDGSLISRPGYDQSTGLLFLPTGGQPTAAIPAKPTPDDVRTARMWIDYMLQDFDFETPNDVANYIGLMLSPLLRAVVPPPYKLGVIEAHQPGSGKSFLARALVTIHSGVMHSEMAADDVELKKVVSSDLDVSTGAVIVFDNVSGVVRSSVLAGLLTMPRWTDRRLGTGKLIDAANDRLWVMTANNAVLAGDLARRSMRVRIDPGVPNPEDRTDFVIPDFEGWVREHRGDLLWSTIVLVQNWVAHGSPVPDTIRGDSFGRWAAVVGSILASAGYTGTFDDARQASESDPEVTQWEALLEAAYSVFGETPWTAKDLLGQVGMPGDLGAMPGQAPKPIAHDLLPDALLERRESLTASPVQLARALGKFLQFRQGRWFGEYSVIQQPASSGHKGAARWVIRVHRTHGE